MKQFELENIEDDIIIEAPIDPIISSAKTTDGELPEKTADEEQLINPEMEDRPEIITQSEKSVTADEITCGDANENEDGNDTVCDVNTEKNIGDNVIETVNTTNSTDCAHLHEELLNIQQQIEELRLMFTCKIENDEHKATLFDKMYNELQSYKTDIYAKLLKPFINATISLIDDTNSFLSRLGENESRKAEKYLRNIPDDLWDILEQCGMERYDEESEIFNPRMQKAIKAIPTSNPSLDKHIARRIRAGYLWNGTIIKPELVQIYKYETSN